MTDTTRALWSRLSDRPTTSGCGYIQSSRSGSGFFFMKYESIAVRCTSWQWAQFRSSSPSLMRLSRLYLSAAGVFSMNFQRGAGPDHPVDVHCPEGRYLKALLVQRRA